MSITKEIVVEGKQNKYILAGDILQIINKHDDDNPKRYLVTLEDLPYLSQILMKLTLSTGGTNGKEM